MNRLLLRTWMFLRRNLWIRDFEELHTEALYSDTVFKKLIAYAKTHPRTYLMLTCPTQDLWHRIRIQADRIPEGVYRPTIDYRYKKLAEATKSLGVHVHLFGPYSVKIPNYDAQYDLIKEAKEYLSNLGLPTEDFAPGWNQYNADTVKACEDLGFKRFHVSQVRNGCERSDKLKFVMVYNVAHDWSLK